MWKCETEWTHEIIFTKGPIVAELINDNKLWSSIFANVQKPRHYFTLDGRWTKRQAGTEQVTPQQQVSLWISRMALKLAMVLAVSASLYGGKNTLLWLVQVESNWLHQLLRCSCSRNARSLLVVAGMYQMPRLSFGTVMVLLSATLLIGAMLVWWQDIVWCNVHPADRCTLTVPVIEFAL